MEYNTILSACKTTYAKQYKKPAHSGILNILERMYDAVDPIHKLSPVPHSMQDIKLSSIQLKNIACFTELNLSFHQQSVFTISGAVGSGKSSILDAIYFGLTGHSLKSAGISLGELIKQPHDTGYIELELMVNDKPLVIQRFLKVAKKKFSKQTIVQYNNQEYTTDEDVRAFLQKVIPLDTEQLKYLMFLGHGNITGLLSVKNTKLSEIIVNKVFNLGVCSAIREQANLWQEQGKKMIVANNNRISRHQASIAEKKKQIVYINSLGETTPISELNAQCSVIKDEMKKSKGEISELQKHRQVLNVQLVDDVIAGLRMKIVDENLECCPVCEQKIETSEAKHKIQLDVDVALKIQEIDGQISKLKKSYQNGKSKLVSLAKEIEKSTMHQAQIDVIEYAIQILENDIKYRDSLNTKIKKEICNCEQIQYLFNEKGMKSVTKYLSNMLYQSLCDYSQPYIKKLIGPDAEIYCDECIFYLKHKGTNLMMDWKSGGERIFVSLALELGLRKFLCDRANLHLNVLMIDEGFHVLKKDTLQAFVQILEEDCNIETVGLITHNSELIENLNWKLVVEQNQAHWNHSAASKKSA